MMAFERIIEIVKQCKDARHLVAEMFSKVAGTYLVHVPYKGVSMPAVQRIQSR